MSDLIERLRSGDASWELREKAADEIERLEGDLQVTRLQRDARMVSEFVVDDAVKAEIERLQSDNKWLGELRDQLCSDKALLTALRKEDGEDMQRLSDQLDYLSDENAKLQIVVDAAEDYLSDPHNDSEQALFKAIAAWRFKAIAARRGEK